MGAAEILGGAASFVEEHLQEVPLGIQLRGMSKVHHDVRGDAMQAHLFPVPRLTVAGVDDTAQQRHHPQLFQ